jgi:hypothetical protein
MARRSHFRVFGPRAHLDGATEATVSIDRALGLVSVRPLRRRRAFELPLADVAAMVISRVAKAELAEKRRAKAERRRGGRR